MTYFPMNYYELWMCVRNQSMKTRLKMRNKNTDTMNVINNIIIMIMFIFTEGSN